MNICIKCKAELPEGAAFCPACGKKQVADARKHRKRANGTGNISKLSGTRTKPWLARKNGVSIGTYATRAEAQKALERVTDATITDKYNLTFRQIYEAWKPVQERVHLGHEIGHCVTGSFYNRYAAADSRDRHENRADKWAVKQLIPVEELDKAVAEGCTEIWELAERFGVTEEFIRKAVCYYVHGNLATELYF